MAGVDHYVGLEHLDSDSLKIRRWGTPADVEAQKLRFRAGDIIFAKRRAYQRKVGVADFDGICSAHAFVFRGNETHIVPELLPYFIQTDAFMDRAIAISKGSLSPTINWGDLAREEFALPTDPAEQTRIAELLRAADEAVEAWREAEGDAVALHETFTRQEMCSEEWSRIRMGDLIHRLVPGSSVLGSNEPARNGSFGVLKVSAVGGTGFVPEENKAILDQSDFDPAFEVRKGDLLITRCNTKELVGRVCLVDSNFPTLMLCDKTIRIDEKEEVVSKRFLYGILGTPELRRQIEGKAKGTGGSMKNISQNDIRSLLVPLPPLSLQQNFDLQTEQLSRTKLMATAHRTSTKSLYKQLLFHLLTLPTEPTR